MNNQRGKQIINDGRVERRFSTLDWVCKSCRFANPGITISARQRIHSKGRSITRSINCMVCHEKNKLIFEPVENKYKNGGKR